jgi:hypothetical protein
MLDPYEAKITRTIFEHLAQRRLTDKEVEDIIANVKVTAEIIRNTHWLRQELGLDPPRKARKKRRR